MNKVLVDTGFWFALFDPKDDLKAYDKAKKIFNYLEKTKLLIPWPTLYETFNTRFSKKSNLLIQILKKDNVILIDDTYYKESALINLEQNFRKRDLSLVDLIIREILTDKKIRINFLVSFNVKDFVDVCQRKQITIIDQNFN
ncbi:MAG: hypothetical protein L3J74_08110 [Bacteroidales bacterium]|nr:hypothetical protein [Bacteroidales bacterium]